MGFKKDRNEASDLQYKVRSDEMNVPVTYDKDEINQAIKHTREDIVLIYSMVSSAVKQLHMIKYVLIAILIVLILGLI